MTLTKRRIMYIEDHDDTRELISLVLLKQGYEVVVGSTIEHGLALASEQRFDLYLLDSWLPDGSGLDLCRNIRVFDQATPILFYSAAAYELDRELAMASGAQAYLIKPSQNSDLCNLAETLINQAVKARNPEAYEVQSSGPLQNPVLAEND